jgi:hypothetical protein
VDAEKKSAKEGDVWNLFGAEASTLRRGAEVEEAILPAAEAVVILLK